MAESNSNHQHQRTFLDEQDELIKQGLRGPALLAALEKRRRQVRELWLRSMSVAAIARTCKCSERTVRRDLIAVRRQLQLERLPTLHDDLNRAVATHRTAQAEAWVLYSKLDDRAQNKVACLDLIIKSELAIAKLLGLEAPDGLNSRVLGDLQEVLTRTLEQTGGPELVRAFLEQLKLQHARTTVTRLLTRGPMGAETETETVEADQESTSPPVHHDGTAKTMRSTTSKKSKKRRTSYERGQ